MIKIYLSRKQWEMLGQAWHCYSHDFWDEMEQGGDKRQIKTFEALHRKLFCETDDDT